MDRAMREEKVSNIFLEAKISSKAEHFSENFYPRQHQPNHHTPSPPLAP